MSPRPSGWASNGPAFLMALTRWGFSCKRADLHCPRKWAGPSEPEEEAGAWGAVASLEARVNAGEAITIFVVGSLQAGAELFMLLSL